MAAAVAGPLIDVTGWPRPCRAREGGRPAPALGADTAAVLGELVVARAPLAAWGRGRRGPGGRADRGRPGSPSVGPSGRCRVRGADVEIQCAGGRAPSRPARSPCPPALHGGGAGFARRLQPSWTARMREAHAATPPGAALRAVHYDEVGRGRWIAGGSTPSRRAVRCGSSTVRARCGSSARPRWPRSACSVGTASRGLEDPGTAMEGVETRRGGPSDRAPVPSRRLAARVVCRTRAAGRPGCCRPPPGLLRRHRGDRLHPDADGRLLRHAGRSGAQRGSCP